MDNKEDKQEKENEAVSNFLNNPIKFSDIDITQLYAKSAEQIAKINESNWLISFRKNALKSKPSNVANSDKMGYLTQIEIVFLCYYLKSKLSKVYFIPAAARTTFDSLKLFLNTLFKHCDYKNTYRSLNDIIISVAKPINDGDFDQLKNLKYKAEFDNYARITEFDYIDYLDLLLTNKNSNVINLNLTHSQEEIDNADKDEFVHPNYNGMSHSFDDDFTFSNLPPITDQTNPINPINPINQINPINTTTDTTNTNISATTKEMASEATTLFRSRASNTNNIHSPSFPIFTTRDITNKTNFENFCDAVNAERLNILTNDSDIYRQQLLVDILANLYMFNFSTSMPASSPIRNSIAVIAKTKDLNLLCLNLNKQLPYVRIQLFETGIIDGNGYIINLKKYKSTLKHRKIPHLIISKFSPISRVRKKPDNCTPLFNNLFKTNTRRPRIATTSMPLTVATTNPNKPLTQNDIINMTDQINSSVTAKFNQLKQALDRKEYAKKPEFEWNEHKSNQNQLISINTNDMIAAVIDKQKKQECILKIVDVAITNNRNKNVVLVNNLINAKVGINGQRLTNKDIVRQLEGNVTMSNIALLQSPALSANIKSVLTSKIILSIKADLIMFITGTIDEDFSFLNLMYQINKYLNKKCKLLHENFSIELKSLFNKKWNIYNTFGWIREYINDLNIKFNKLIPKNFEEAETYRLIRLWFDYKSYDIKKLMETLLYSVKDSNFDPHAMAAWVDRGVSDAIIKNQCFTVIFTSNFMNNQRVKDSKITLDIFLSNTFNLYSSKDTKPKSPKSENIKEKKKHGVNRDLTDNDAYYNRQRERNETRVSHGYRENYRNRRNRDRRNRDTNKKGTYHQNEENQNRNTRNHNPESNRNRYYDRYNGRYYNERSNDRNYRNERYYNQQNRLPSNQNSNINQSNNQNVLVVAVKTCKELLRGTGKFYSLKSRQCAAFNADNSCYKGADNCQRDHCCILHPTDPHPLCNCPVI